MASIRRIRNIGFYDITGTHAYGQGDPGRHRRFVAIGGNRILNYNFINTEEELFHVIRARGTTYEDYKDRRWISVSGSNSIFRLVRWKSRLINRLSV